VSYDYRFGNIEVLQKPPRVQRHIVKVVRDYRFGRPAKADLVRDYDAKALFPEDINRACPVLSKKIHAVKQDYRATIGLATGGYVHVGHAYVLAIESEREIRDRIRVGNIIERNAARLNVGWSGRLLLRLEQGLRVREANHEAENYQAVVFRFCVNFHL
jgi:hypothetical protein